MQKSVKRRALSFILAFLLALTPLFSASAAFADMTNHWSKSYVDDMALRGIINGYSDNTFKPEASVTTAELLVMLSRMHGADPDMVDTIYADYKNYLTNLFGNEYAWAHKSLAVCLDTGIVTRVDLETLQNTKAFGAPALKENLAEYIVRGMGLSQVAANLPSYSLSFKDTDSIAVSKRPYIYVLNTRKIVEGDTDGNFMPKSGVSRAVTATMLSRAMEYMEANNLTTAFKKYTSNAVSGVVQSASLIGTNMVYTVKNAVTETEEKVTAPTSTPVYLDGEESTYSSITPGRYLVARLDADKKPLSLNVTKTPQTVTGNITSIDPGKVSILTPTGSIVRYYLDRFALVKSGPNKGGRSIISPDAGYKQATVVADDAGKVKTLVLSGGHYLVEGIVDSVTTGGVTNYIRVRTYDGIAQRFAVPTNVSVTVNTLSNDLSESFVGFYARCKLESDTGALTAVEIDTTLSMAQGSYRAYNSTSSPARLTLTNTATNETSSFNVGSEALVFFEGKSASMSSLSYGDFLTVKIKNNVATEIYAYPGSSTVQGKITSITYGNPIVLQVTDETGKVFEYSFEPGAIPSIKRGETYTTIDKLYGGDSVTLDIRYNKVSLITVAVHTANAEGTIKKISMELSGSSITVTNDNGVDITYALAPNARILRGDTVIALSDVKIGNRVTMSVVNSEITSLSVANASSAAVEISGTVEFVNTTDTSLLIGVTAGGVKSTIAVDASVARILKTSGAAMSFKDLVYGDLITLYGSYSGANFKADMIIKK